MVEFKSFLAEVQPKYILTEQPRSQVTSPTDAYKSVINHFDADTLDYREQVIVLYLNRANNTIGVQRLSVGSQSASIIDAKIVFAMGLLIGASGIILAHNHPSGQMKPSNADLLVTESIASFGKMIGMQLLDHIIVVRDSFISLKEEGLL